MNRYQIIPYNTCNFDFVTPVTTLLGAGKLEDLHEEHDHIFKVGADSATSFHQKFYDRYHAGWPEMVDLYERFVRELIAPVFSWRPLLYQKFPTFRVHLRHNVAVGAFHTDAEFGHPSGEVNFIIPLTNSDGDASVWVESEPGKGDFKAMVMRIGEFIMFNGNQLTHGNKLNTTAKTRVSMDFRVLPVEAYNAANAAESMTRKTKFKEGEYYKRFQIMETDANA